MLFEYSDSDWTTGEDDRKSTSDFCLKVIRESSVVSWACKKQAYIASSSCEAEYVALAAQEAIIMQGPLVFISCSLIVTKPLLSLVTIKEQSPWPTIQSLTSGPRTSRHGSISSGTSSKRRSCKRNTPQQLTTCPTPAQAILHATPIPTLLPTLAIHPNNSLPSPHVTSCPVPLSFLLCP